MGWRLLGTLAAGIMGTMGTMGGFLYGCGVGEFVCQSSAQCTGAGAGVCQPDGYCSFPAAVCPTGQRYGEHSGPHSGQCVGEDGEAASSGAMSSSSSSGLTAPDGGPGLDSGEPTGDDAISETASSGDATGEPVDPDLVLWLALDRAPLGTVPDSSSYMGDGTCEGTGCPEGGRGVVSGGAWFDGTDDFITVPHAPWLEAIDGFTIAAFIRIGDVPSDFRVVMAKPYGRAYANSWEIYFEDQVLYTGMGGADGEYSEVVSPWTFPPDEWVHVASRWDGDLLTLWLDGKVAGSIEAAAIAFDEQAIHVGADDDHYQPEPIGYFLGDIDDVRVYRRALSADEIAALAAG